MQMENKIFLAVVVVVLFILVIGIAGYFLVLQYINSAPPAQNNNQQQTTQTDPTAGWNVVKNNELGFSMQYPNNFFDAGHEPKITTRQCSFDEGCQNNERLVINAVTYCHNQTQEGAAGHQYYYDYYTAVKNQQCLEVDLVTATTTCENYLPIESGNTQQADSYSTCVTQRENRPKILQQITNTFQFTK